MTEKQRALLENLPKCNNNRTKAALMAGYSKSYAETLLHTAIRKYKGIERDSDDEVKEKYLKRTRKLQRLCLKKNDLTNASRMHEVEGKVKGLFKDGVSLDNSDKIIIQEVKLLPANDSQPVKVIDEKK